MDRPALTFLPGRRGVPTMVTVRQSALDDLTDELTALIAEDLDHARDLLALTRDAMVDVAHGRSPANHLLELEQLVHRLIYQRKAASAALAAATAEPICPCGAIERHAGCGVAA